MLATHRIEPCVQYTQSEDKSWWWLLHRGGPTPDPHTQDMALGVPRDRREKGRKVSLGKAPLGYTEDQRKNRKGRMGMWALDTRAGSFWNHTCPSWRAGSGWRPSAGCRQSHPRCGRGAVRWAHPRGTSMGSCRGAVAPSRLLGDPWG